jgi:hypothetical protein
MNSRSAEPLSRTERGELLPRTVHGRLLEALAESRAVALLGPRQVGKTTLVRDLFHNEYQAVYLTLDDAATRNAALEDPTGFIHELESKVIIDEIQRVPDLLLSIKQRLDRINTPGQFLLTGSANVLTLPSIRDALPGRLEYVHLWPFAASELQRQGGEFIDRLFSGNATVSEGELERRALVERIATGGFPLAQGRTWRSRRRFFEAYVDSVAGRDVADRSSVRDPARVGRLLRLVASRSPSLLSRDSLAADLGVDRKTVEHHLRILEDLYLIRTHPAWHTNLPHREVKTPKVYVTDTGLQTGLIGADTTRLSQDGALLGAALETFVAMELVKLASWSDASPRAFHYRDRDGREIDLILERSDGSIVGIEVKASATVSRDNFRALTYLRDKVGDRFLKGIVLFSGPRSLPFGDRLEAVPLSALWG